MNVRELLELRAQKNPEHPAIIFRDSPITFRALKEKSFSLACALGSLGIVKGDRVAIYLPNWPEYLYSYLAIWCLGATAVPLDFMLTEEELLSCVSHCEAKILIAKSKNTVSFASLKKGAPTLKNIVATHEKTDGCLFLEELVDKAAKVPPAVEIEDKDRAIIFYTSGTTGKPKGVLVNYRQLDAPPKGMQYFVDLYETDFTLCALPFSHLGGLIYLQTLVSFGFTVVLMERFIPREFLKNLQRYKVNWFWLVPSMYYAILQLKEFDAFELPTLRWIVIFGAPSSPDAILRFHQRCPQAHIINGWGMTETNAPTVVLPLGSKKIESVGRPNPWTEIKIFDDTDKELPQGKIGEIVARGWAVTEGYYNDPELTALTMRSGWFHTGDLGKFDSEGFLYIVGRKKEMIKVAGEIVFEPEVEAAIHKNPDVVEVAVVGVPDNLRGEVPKAFIILREGAEITTEDLRYFCRQHLAHFKIPHYFEFVDSLPKNRMGKIEKEKLR
ncbi:MAG: class I adenylate-forming enzyme family protein [Deltaproteobacteria bacterium]